MSEVPSGVHHAYYRPEFVVAVKHADEVTRVLQDLGVRFDEPEKSEDLGLALVRLPDDKAAATTMADVLQSLRDRAYGLSAPPEAAATDMDRFLRALRAYFAGRYSGWVPVLGKNRLVGQVIGGGKVSHGGGGEPLAQASPLKPRKTDSGRGVRVGVLDTPISSQDWLAGGWVSPATEVLDRKTRHRAAAGHATFIAGLVLEQAPGCVVEARSVLSPELGEADSWNVAKAIAEFGRSRPDVLNLSFTCYTEDGQAPLTLAAAIERLDPETVVVAAAGNHGDLNPEPEHGDRRKPAWPAALDCVVAVGAADGDGREASFTPHDVQWIDVLAPGVDMVSTFLSGAVDVGPDPDEPVYRDFSGYANWSGTSFAAAYVSGAIAARTEPGRVSARQAWGELLTEARGRSNGAPQPPFLKVG